MIPKPLTLLVCFFTALLGVQAQTAVAVFAANAQHTANYQPAAQNPNAIHWSSSVDSGGVDSGGVESGNHGTLAHHGAPAISAANTVFVPVRTASGFQINAISGKTGVSMYALSTDYVLPEHNSISSYSPALATSPSGTRLYYAGAGGSVYYIENPDSRPGSAPVRQVFYGLSGYQANTAGFNSTVFINTPITADTKGNIFFGFSVQGAAPAPLNTAQSGFARIDSAGKATYVLAGAAAGDNNIARDSRNSAPALSNDESTVYVLVKAAHTDSYGYLLGLDSNTLATKYRTPLKDPRNGNYATLSDDSMASPMVAPDNDVYLGVLGNPQDSHRGFLLHFSADLSVEKVPGAFGGDFTPAIVPATMVTSYTGSSSYLIFSKYNDYPGDDGGQGINRIALLDPNSTQLDPRPSAHGLTEMREVLTAGSITPDAHFVAAGFPLAVSEWSGGTPAVNAANNSVYVPNADGHIYRWDLSTNSLSQSVTFGDGAGADGAVPVEIGPDGTVYTITGGNLFAAGDAAGVGVSVTSSAPDLRSVIVGDAITFTASVTRNPRVVPTGAVTFQDVRFQGATPLSVTLGTVPVDAAGRASFTTSSLQAGAHFITATYSGSANTAGGSATSATLVQSVHASATAVTLTLSQDALTATVSPLSALISRLPSGMVTFTDNDNVVAQIPLSGGTASFTVPAPRAGTHVFGAIYSSDGTFATSSGTLAEGSRTTNRSPVAGNPATAGSRGVRPLTSSSGVLYGICGLGGIGCGDYSQNPENLTLEGTSDWIHWGDTLVTRKASGNSQISSFTLTPNTTLFTYQNDPRLLSWTDGTSNLSSSFNNQNGIYVSGANNGFSFTAPADTTMRTLVVHAGGYFSAGRLTAHLSDSSAADFVDITNPITALYDRNYVLTYKAASAGQTLMVSWVEVTDLGAGNVDLNAAALSLFSGTITPVSGSPQSTAVGTAFATPLQVSVTDANSNPVGGVTVTFTAPTPTATAPQTGSFSSGATATAVTGSNGIASAPALTANTVAGGYYITASVAGVPNTAQFSVTNNAGPPVSIVAVAGTPASAVANTAFTTALQALVKDSYSNPVSGATVTFGTPTSGPSAVFASGTTATAVTNASGIAFAPALRANSQFGTYLVAATVATGVTPAYYTLTNTYGGNGFLAGAGDNSSAAVNLTAVGTSDWIHWDDPTNPNRKASGGSQIGALNYASTMVGQNRTGGSAGARVTKLHPENMGFEGYGNDMRLMNWTDGTPTAVNTGDPNGVYIDYGTYITSGRNGFTFTAPADLTARTLIVYAGGTNSGGTLVAHLSDASAPDFVDTTAVNIYPYDRNYTLTYSAASPGQTLTITWSMTSGTGNVTLSGSALSVGVPSTITAMAGTPQTAMVNTMFGAPLQVKVADANGNALNGVIVTFIAPGTGASATFSGGSSAAVATTNSSGVAVSPALTANGAGGSYQVTATLAGASAPAVFSLTNLIPGGSLSLSGNSAETTVNLTTAGTLDWVHWGPALIHKSGVSPQIGNNYTYTVTGPQSTYTNDPRTLTWTDGTPTAGGSDTSGVYTATPGVQNGFSFTVPADTTRRTLTVYVGGYVTTGMLTAHLSDQSAADQVDIPAFVNGPFDRNYTLTYNAASAGQTLTVSWVSTLNSGNVTLSGAALSITPPSIVAVAGTPQSAQLNTPFATALQALVKDASGNLLSGATVTFTAQTSAGGASATFSGSPSATAVTNAAGIATAPVLTANGQVGGYTVTATVPGATTPATFSLGNGGTLSGSGNSSSAAVNLTTVGTADWVHWGDAALNRKSGVGPQINNYMVVGQPVKTYPDDARALSWSDGTPTASNSSDTNGLDVYYTQNGFSFTVPADSITRTLSVYVGGYQSSGMLTAHLSDLSAPDYVDTTVDTTGSQNLTYDRNYTLTYTAASAGQTLTVSWVSASGPGNVNWSGAALSGPKALVPQTISFGPLSAVNLGVAPFPVSATASSGLPVTFTSTTTGVCTVAGNTVTIAAAGLCSITASQAGNSTYAAAVPVTQSFSVNAIFQAGSFTLAQGASVSVGTSILVMQNDGNLVLYQAGSAVWSTGTFGQNCGASKCVAVFQSDGNFVVYNGSTPLWNSGTFGNPGAQLVFSGQFPQLQIIATNQSVLWRNLTEFSAGNFTLAQGASFTFGSLSLVMQNDGNLVLYSQSGPVWSTGTFGQNCGASQCFANFQSDGSLVVHNGSAILWSSGTAGDPGALLVFGAQSPQLQIIGSNQSVLWTDVSFSAGTFALSQGASVNFGSFSLVMQNDGNLVLYQQGSPAVWSTGTWGQNCGAASCVTVFQGDGNLVVYNGSTPLWSSGTFGNPGAKLVFSSQAPQVQIISGNSVRWAI